MEVFLCDYPILVKKKFDFVYHFAAQAGVRYSLINPNKYIQTNIVGFFNLMEIFRKKKVKRFFYASSSSVYGDSTKFPLKENEKMCSEIEEKIRKSFLLFRCTFFHFL